MGGLVEAIISNGGTHSWHTVIIAGYWINFQLMLQILLTSVLQVLTVCISH